MRFALAKLFLPLLLAPLLLRAQTQPRVPAGNLIQLQVQQPAVDVSSPVTATAAFSPPVVRPGEKAFYRVTVDATESSIQWPEKIVVPPELKFGPNDARGQLTQSLGNRFRPLTSFVYEVRATATGHFVITNFTVNVYNKPVEIPAAGLDVVTENPNPQPARQLVLETSTTNVFLGEPFRVRVMLPAGPGNETEALREIQLNGDGLMTDKNLERQSIEPANINGQLKPAFICEMLVTPIMAGRLKISAQGFTAGREFGGPISIHGPVSLPGGPSQYVLLVSDPVEISVQPLPAEGELPGFTGVIGKLSCDPPQLSTNRLRVGEPVHLKVVFFGDGDVRLVPPNPPRSPDWQIIADNPPDIGYTLIPETDEVRETPAIPFSYFDPVAEKYVDLTIPPVPVSVVGESLPVQLPAFDDESEGAAPLKLSGLASALGKAVGSLKPPQSRGWFVLVQLLPVVGFFALSQWDRRRRFLESHPEIARRRKARRALRREKSKLQKALATGDAAAFVRHAADAMRIAVAPQNAANPQALVCADVLAQLADADQNSRAGETVRKIFAAADAQFAASAQTRDGCLALKFDVEAVLQKLEETL